MKLIFHFAFQTTIISGTVLQEVVVNTNLESRMFNEYAYAQSTHCYQG